MNSSYRKLFGASVVSNLGDGMGLIAYPWLASAVTRNGALVAAVALAQRLPWLVLSLPAGVVTDRVDRRRAMVAMDLCRATITAVVAVAVLGVQGSLPAPDEVGTVTGTRVGLYLLVVLATVLLGSAEVLRDNASQTLMPSLVEPEDLEKANGRMWSAETVANTLAGPALGSVLLAVAFSLPIFLDAGSFFVAAALVALIPGTFRAAAAAQPASFRADLREGFGWLWRHDLLRPMCITLGLMNLASTLALSTFVLFAQDVLKVGPTVFAVLTMGGAVGGVVGGVVAPWLSARLGAGTCLGLTLGGIGATSLATGLSPWWPPIVVFFSIEALLGVLWNVITVSLRQRIIPPELLGRVNSVYRFFAWGMMPIGAGIGGLLVLVVEAASGREAALRSTWIASGLIYGALFVVARSRLTSERLAAAEAGFASNTTG